MARFVHEETGQNIVEFALLLPILMYILLGIIQFGFIFATYVTLNNAVREGARWGTIYVYDNSTNANSNDGTRNDGIVDRIYASRGILAVPARGSSSTNMDLSSNGTISSPGTSCPETSPAPELGFKYPNGGSTPDLTICYARPSVGGVPINANDPRRGYYLDVEAWYHLQVFIPLLQQFLPDDPVKGAPWIRIPARITVVVN